MRFVLFFKNIPRLWSWCVVNVLSGVRVLPHIVLIPIPPFVATSVQAVNSYSARQELTATLDRLMMNCLQYKSVFRLEELVGEAERLYIFYPRFKWMEDSFCHMTVITDSRWVNQLVGEGSVPRFRFYDDSDLMGEDSNDVLDFDGNNDE